MGVPLVIPLTVKCAYVGHDVTTLRPINVTFGVKATVAPTESDLIDITTSMYTPTFAFLPSSWEIDSAEATSIDTATSPQYINNTSVIGTAGASYPGMAAVTTFHCSLRGRSFKGRNYFPVPQTDVAVDNGLVTGSYLTALTNFWDDVNAALGSQTNVCSLAVISRKLLESTIVTNVAARSAVGYIRRRQAA